MTRFFEDLTVGETGEYGEYHVTEDEIVEFAEQYDPQWFHTDPERAREESMYGDVIASGWHTAAMTMRLLVDGFLAETATLGAKGVDKLRWHRPVTPGDTLSIRTEVLEKKPETEDRGVARCEVITEADDGEEVFSMVGLVMFARRDLE